MHTVMRLMRGAKLAAVIAAALTIGACANKSNDLANAGMSAAPGSQQDFVVNVGDRVFFETDSSDLTPQARATLDKQAQWLSQYNRYTFTIEGHADERGTREYNLALGERRAAAARNALIAMGIEPRRLATVSYGKERPQVLGSTEQAWGQNRRGVLLVN